MTYMLNQWSARLCAFLLCFVMLAGCTVQLVPAYDSVVVEKLDTLNEDTFVLLSALENGSSAEEFEDYEPRYNELIGRFDALRVRTETRHVPTLANRLPVISGLELCRTDDNPTACLNTSPAALRDVASQLRTLRDRHRANGLESGNVALARGAIEIGLEQATTVENALER
ncbi:MAG: hypothetical protein AAGE05_05985 [Pseudomonadota bacterium]